MIFVSADCHCSPLNILESRGVAVRGRKRRGGGVECHTTRRKRQANTCFVAEWQGNAGVAVIKRVLLLCASMHGKAGANLQSLCWDEGKKRGSERTMMEGREEWRGV